MAAPVKSLDAYLPAAIRASPALVAQARTPRTAMAMAASAAGAGLPDDLDLGASAIPSPSPSPSPPAVAAGDALPSMDVLLPPPSSPGRKTSLVVNYSLGPGGVGGCDSLGMIDGMGTVSSTNVRPVGSSTTSTAVPFLSSPAGK